MSSLNLQHFIIHILNHETIFDNEKAELVLGHYKGIEMAQLGHLVQQYHEIHFHFAEYRP